jgi:hypothetical protein
MKLENKMQKFVRNWKKLFSDRRYVIQLSFKKDVFGKQTHDLSLSMIFLEKSKF